MAEWQAFDRLSPVGAIRGDFQAALIATTFANAMRGERQKPYKLDDFMLKFNEEKKKQQSGKEIASILKSICR